MSIKDSNKKEDFDSKIKVDFEQVRSVLREASIRGLIRDGRYDGKQVSVLGLFIHHGMTTKEIAFFSNINEPAIRKIVLETYNRIKMFI